MKFIIYILFIYIIFRLFSGLILRYLAHRIKKTTMSGNEFSKEHYSGQENSKKKKIINQDDGDYVDFEELEK